MTHEHHALHGCLAVRMVDRQGRTTGVVVQENTVVSGGQLLVGRLLVGDATAVAISHLAVGTDSRPTAPADTGLAAEITTISRAPIAWELLPDSTSLRVSAQVSSETAQAVAEAGLFNAGGHGEGVMYNRVTFPSPVPVGTDLDLVFEWDLTFGSIAGGATAQPADAALKTRRRAQARRR
jgi:hypothetical protein